MVRLIHTCGQVDVAEHVAYSDDVVARTHAALRRGRPGPVRLVDGRRGHHRKSRLPADNEVVSLVADPRAADLAGAAGQHPVGRRASTCGPTGSAARCSPSATRRPRCSGCWNCIDDGAPTPAAVLGGPVGFVGSAQSKQELIDRPRGMSYLVVTGRRGGSAMAAAAVNAIASEAE